MNANYAGTGIEQLQTLPLLGEESILTFFGAPS